MNTRDKWIAGIVAVALVAGMASTMRDGIAHGEQIKRIDQTDVRHDREIDSLAVSNLELGKSIGKMELNLAVMREILERLDERDKRAEFQVEFENRKAEALWLQGVNVCDMRSPPVSSLDWDVWRRRW